MIRAWFDASGAAEIGIALADQFTRPPASGSATPSQKAIKTAPADPLKDLFQRADREIRPLRLNFYKKAKFANSFKWRLLENGVKRETADEITQTLIVHLSGNGAPATEAGAAPLTRSPSGGAKQVLAHGRQLIAQGAYDEAVALYEEWLRANSPDAAVVNHLGVALSKLGRHEDAESRYRQAVKMRPDLPDGHANLGALLYSKGRFADAEGSLRRALKLNPRHIDARINLGSTLASRNRPRDAKAHFEKVLKFSPRNSDALLGLAVVAKTEGRFDEANTLASRALEFNPKLSRALALLAGVRKMTSSEGTWLARAESLAADSGIAPDEEAELRFAIGKYYDDIDNFNKAFENYRRGNELLKPMAANYDRNGHVQFVDDMIRLYPGDTARPANGASASVQPVFVVGMPRSGTSLTEQIISSHPLAKGAGELEFWIEALRKHWADIQNGQLDKSTKQQLADACLHALHELCGDAPRIVDKTPFNSDYLGLIHSVFPNARIIYMRRDPIDSCLSCYFQKFALSLNYTTDLPDLAHYYRQHVRLMAHWRAVLPAGTILDVPYEGLVAAQEEWTRKILEFLGLDWDARCLNFHQTNRTVSTASFWQVRQKIFQNSVGRWRHYEQFVKPLQALSKLQA